MSYYTILELSWDDSDYPKGSIAVGDILLAAKPYIEANGWHDDVLGDIENAAKGFGNQSPGFNGIHGVAIIDLLQQVSLKIPQVRFFARGVGEEFDDFWSIELLAGEAVTHTGPYAEE